MSLKIQKQLPPLRLKIFDILGFIKNQILPFFSPEALMILNNKFVRRNTDVKSVGFGPSRSFGFPLFLGAIIRENFKTRTPLFALHLPIEHDWRGHDYEMRTPISLFTCEMGEQCYRLNSLTQTHFVSENSIQFSLVHC